MKLISIGNTLIQWTFAARVAGMLSGSILGALGDARSSRHLRVNNQRLQRDHNKSFITIIFSNDLLCRITSSYYDP